MFKPNIQQFFERYANVGDLIAVMTDRIEEPIDLYGKRHVPCAAEDDPDPSEDLFCLLEFNFSKFTERGRADFDVRLHNIKENQIQYVSVGVGSNMWHNPEKWIRVIKP